MAFKESTVILLEELQHINATDLTSTDRALSSAFEALHLHRMSNALDGIAMVLSSCTLPNAAADSA